MSAGEKLQRMIQERTRRATFFDEDLFADPAWDILLDLYQAELEQRRISVSSCCIAAKVPQTTALRWINRLLRQGMLERASDPLDGRRIFVALSDDASRAMYAFLDGSRAAAA